MKLYSHPKKLLSSHLTSVASNSKKIIKDKQLNLEISTEKLAEISYLIGLCHDFGKITSFFQNYIFQETPPKDERLKRHSLISALFSYYVISTYCKINKIPEKYAMMATLAIKRHHGNLDSITQLFNIEESDKIILKKQLGDIAQSGNFKLYEKLLKEYKLNISVKELIQQIRETNLDDLWWDVEDKISKFLSQTNSMEIFLVQELLYSILIDCDKKDAANLLTKKFNTSKLEIDEKSVDIYLEHMRKNNPKKFNPDSPKDKKLVQLKNKIYNQCVNSQHLTPKNKIYSLTAPTGIGKTFTSMSTALKLKSKIKNSFGKDYKIHYILPFTTIIDQNYKEFRSILSHSCKDFQDRENDYLIKHHYVASNDNSEASPYLKKMSEDNKMHYQPKSYFDDLLFIKSWDSKVVVSTYVQLMHTIIGGKNSFMNKLHNIVNSIIILDEVQCISLKYWELTKLLTKTLAKKFNVYFIFLTATQPLIFKNTEICELTSSLEPEETNLLDRVKIYNLINEKGITTKELFKIFKEQESNNLKNRYLFILNTKRSSLELYEQFKKEKKNESFSEHKLFYLSTNLTKHDRDKKLQSILGKKDKIDNWIIKPVEKYILVTTQLVEAGVDISSDVCYRDLAPVDSIIQSAGRVNRFGELKNKGILNLVLIKQINEKGGEYEPNSIYGKNLINWTKESLSEETPKFSKDFPKLCSNFYKKGYNTEGQTKEHSEDIINAIKELNFSLIKEKFRFIESYPTHTIFILNEDSKQLIQKYKKICCQHWNDDDKFQSKKKGELKKLRTHFSKYTIEITPKKFENNNYIKNDINQLGEDFYYIDLSNLDKNERDNIYSFETGFNLNNDQTAEFW